MSNSYQAEDRPSIINPEWRKSCWLAGYSRANLQGCQLRAGNPFGFQGNCSRDKDFALRLTGYVRYKRPWVTLCCSVAAS
jgi:hypothetical protein